MSAKHVKSSAVVHQGKPNQISVVFLQKVTEVEREYVTQQCIEALNYLSQFKGNNSIVTYKFEWRSDLFDLS